jgi:hypothetical protein
MVENGFCKYQQAQIFLRQNSCLATSRAAHQTESKSHGGKCVNCLHVLFKFSPKSRFFVRHDVLKSEATVLYRLLGIGASTWFHVGAVGWLWNGVKAIAKSSIDPSLSV